MMPQFDHMIHISRNGEHLGEFQEDQVASLLASGTINNTAFYWREGMADWLPISELPTLAQSAYAEQQPEAPQTAQEAPKKKSKDTPTKTQTNFLAKRNIPFDTLTKTEAQILIDDIKNKEQEEKERKKIERSQSIAEQERIRNAPTPKQLAYLDYHCVPYTPDITKPTASGLIAEAIKRYPDSDWNKVKHNIRPDLYEYHEREGIAKREYDKAVAELAQLKATGAIAQAKQEYDLALARLEKLQISSDTNKDDLEAALEAVEEAKQAIKDENDEYVEALRDATEAVQVAKEEIQSEKEELAEELEEWDMFFGSDGWEFPNTMEDISDYKSVFKKPSKSQVKTIRERFEKVYKIHFNEISKEQFFLVYKLLYPDCIKKGKRADFSVDDITFPSTYSGVKQGKPTKIPGIKSKGGLWKTIVKVCKILLALFILVILYLIYLALTR